MSYMNGPPGFPSTTRILESLPHEGRVVVEIVSTTLDGAIEHSQSWLARHQGYDAMLDGPPQRCPGGWIVTGRRWSKL